MSFTPRPDEVDQQLLSAVAAGDRAALATLYRAYHPRLCQFLTRLTRRADLMDEIVNDSFWIVWQKAAGFRGDSRVSTWIIGIAYRCGLKALRRDGHADLDSLDDDSLPPTLAADEHAEQRELRDWLDKGLSKLSWEQRVIVELVYAGGHSLEEAAAITQAPVGTLKSRLFQARLKLRNLLPALAGDAAPPKENLR
ncbi:RNA polymerase sigma factor [Roseateles sp. LKC17W]|uniref:RNA polymerase sigma factor n=1 Tax=Pelomonas margarita TaxID=3299031 RepID=A0ABW7FI98_9BURK